MRTIRRRHGREKMPINVGAATHVIKIGFDARQPGKNQPFPGKFAGFLVCRDSQDNSGNRQPDHAAMSRIDSTWTPAKLDQAKAQQLKGSGILPVELWFEITRDAVRGPNGWEYPGTFSEGFECYNKTGRFCYGNGVTAYRKNPNGGRDEMKCVPVGCDCEEGEEYCPYSVKKECKAHSELIVCLICEGPDGKPQPVSPDLGYEARYQFSTSSEFNAEGVLRELDAASDRLNGRIARIPGLLTFQIHKRRTGIETAPVGTVGQVVFVLSNEAIRAREDELWNRQLEMRKVETLQVESKAPAALPAPTAPLDEPEDTAFVDTAETFDPEPEPEPEPEPAGEPEPEPVDSDVPNKVEFATDEELARSLSAWAGEHLEDFAWFDYQGRNGETKRQHIDNIDWFFSGQPGAKDAKRRELLREICQRNEDDKSTGFKLLPRREQAVQS